ncbi:hypothetical protein BU25DRAFT_115663 [Macroventuria anomochaeta]|uniref:Uncharacterized protein n=1 Tax=Macroventuria anomochaeta TaxID=301207 RepID=A0ACB6RUZ0_9PLEO|nr:uncharacterized protein BU25DRAFT_115663 [Macroventuria anomochaeta]KAF2625558.1 hypothetical protein BU25DRAFT_115663 [Macroventuria anomochaeta]
MNGCHWVINADPRACYSQRSLPLIVSKSSLGTVRKDLLSSQASTTTSVCDDCFNLADSISWLDYFEFKVCQKTLLSCASSILYRAAHLALYEVEYRRYRLVSKRQSKRPCLCGYPPICACVYLRRTEIDNNTNATKRRQFGTYMTKFCARQLSIVLLPACCKSDLWSSASRPQNSVGRTRISLRHMLTEKAPANHTDAMTDLFRLD